MITLIFQIFLWLLAAFLLGLLLGWFISPFFCKKGGTRTSNAGDHSFINRPSGQDSSVSDAGLRADSNGQRIAATNDTSLRGHDNGDSANGSSLKTNAAAATGIAAAGAAAYAASKSADDKKAAEAAAKAEIEAKRAARARQEAKLAEAEQAQRDAAAIHKKQSSKLAAEHAEAERVEAQKRAAAEAAKQQALEEAKLAEQQAAAKKEADRIAAEKAETDRLIEAKRLADEKLEAEIEADRLRLIEEQRQRDAAEAAKLAEEKRIADEIEADRLKLAEQQRLADEQEARAAKAAEAERIAEEKRVAEEKAETERLATEKLKAEEAEAARIAAEKAEAERLAEEKRIADEKAETERLAAEKLKADEAEAARIAAEKAEAERLAEEKRLEKAEAERLAEEKRRAEEAEAARIEAEKVEAERVAEEKRIADERAEAERLATEKRIADEAEAARIEAEKAEAEAAAKSKSSSSGAIAAAAGIASIAAAGGSASASEETDLNLDAYADVDDNMRPARLASPNNGKADDLKEIRGIGPVIEKTLNSEGVYHYQQIADFTPENVRWVDKNISIPGRVDRDDWIGQAKSLAAGNTYQGFAYDPDTVVITDDMRPEKLASPTGGAADDLKRIKGIGPVIETTLNSEGIYHFKQIADFTPQNTMWVDKHISFPGRIHREDWIGQAKSIIDGREYIGHASVSTDEDSSTDAITDDMRPARGRLKPNQKADDLKVINGIGPVIEESLNDEGVYFYQQIADFSDENARWVDNHMAFPGRIHREDWIGQAKILVGDASATVSDNMKPTLLSKPGAGGAEDLKRIKGIGKVLEKRLHKLGIYHYEQIADLSADNVVWLNDFVSFPEGRIESEDWVGQAKLLAEGKRTDYSDRFDSGETPYK